MTEPKEINATPSTDLLTALRTASAAGEGNRQSWLDNVEKRFGTDVIQARFDLLLQKLPEQVSAARSKGLTVLPVIEWGGENAAREDDLHALLAHRLQKHLGNLGLGRQIKIERAEPDKSLGWYTPKTHLVLDLTGL